MIPNGVEQDIISRPHLSSFFSFEFDIGDSVVLLTIYEMLSLQAEQNAIRRQNDEANQPLSWSQIRNVPLSSKVCSVIYRSSCMITCFQKYGQKL